MTSGRKPMAAALALLVVVCVFAAQERRPGDPPIRQLAVDVDLVLIPVTVTNELGQYISGLEKPHFQVFEDKIEQSIQYFSTEDTPMSLGIVLDSSGSMNIVQAAARRNGGACMEIGRAHV